MQRAHVMKNFPELAMKTSILGSELGHYQELTGIGGQHPGAGGLFFHDRRTKDNIVPRRHHRRAGMDLREGLEETLR